MLCKATELLPRSSQSQPPRVKAQDVQGFRPALHVRTGRQLLVDGDCSGRTARERPDLQKAVSELVRRLNMTQLGNMGVSVPWVIERLGREPYEDEGGISVCSLLSTSHITVHTWPLRRIFKLDVYSCRDFDPKVVLDWAQEHLGMCVFEMQQWRR